MKTMNGMKYKIIRDEDKLNSFLNEVLLKKEWE